MDDAVWLVLLLLQRRRSRTQGHVPRAWWHQCMLRPDGRAAEQSRDRASRASRAETGEGGMVSTLDHDSRNPVQIALTEDGWMLFPGRWKSECERPQTA